MHRRNGPVLEREELPSHRGVRLSGDAARRTPSRPRTLAPKSMADNAAVGNGNAAAGEAGSRKGRRISELLNEDGSVKRARIPPPVGPEVVQKKGCP